jgi:FMN reductase
MPTMVRINGSPTKQSKTGILVDAIGDAIARRMPVESSAISLSDVGHEVMCGLTRADITAEGQSLIQLVERADVLVVGTPVYRASYTGLLKHFFDLVDRDVMRNRKAVLCATGGNYMHALVLEHQLRPLMGFFAIQTTATAIYGVSDDFANGAVSSPLLQDSIEHAADELVGFFGASRNTFREISCCPN